MMLGNILYAFETFHIFYGSASSKLLPIFNLVVSLFPIFVDLWEFLCIFWICFLYKTDVS